MDAGLNSEEINKLIKNANIKNNKLVNVEDQIIKNEKIYKIMRIPPLILLFKNKKKRTLFS